jgi:hypothetical protein
MRVLGWLVEFAIASAAWCADVPIVHARSELRPEPANAEAHQKFNSFVIAYRQEMARRVSPLDAVAWEF